MPIKYSTYDSSSGNTFALTTITGVSGTFTDQVSGALYKTTGGVVVVSGSGDVRPFGLFSFPTESGSSGTYLSAGASGTTTWRTRVDYQLFNSNGTWTKPGGITVVYVELIGGGAGGGASNQGDQISIGIRGGDGGAGGVFLSQLFFASTLSGTVQVTVGVGGSGGPSQTTLESGTFGSIGGASSFGDYLNSLTQANPAQPSFRGLSAYTVATAGNGVGAFAGGTSLFCGGGGGGGGIPSASGGRGGFARFLTTVGSGVLQGENAVADEGGGGGGGGPYVSGTTGVRGGDGAYPGGGGGGGGSSFSGWNSGAGGDGGNGYVKIISW